jgi:predicted dehydrogenase
MRLLALMPPSARTRAQPLLDYLAATAQVALTLGHEPGRLLALDGQDAVLLLPDDLPLPAAGAEALAAFVRRGGGCLSLAAAAPVWLQNPCFRELTGAGEARLTGLSELIARVAPGLPVAARLDPEFVVVDRACLDPAPPDALILLAHSWRYTRYPLLYLRPYGAGQAAVCHLAGAGETLAQPVFQQLLYRALRRVAGRAPGPPVGVGMAGYGAIGLLHGAAVAGVPGLRLTAVCDHNPERRQAARAELGDLRAHADLDDLAADPEVDLAIVSTPPNTHAAVAARLLEAGKHVVVEKPFCLTVREADALIDLAAARNRTLTVYQNRRWDADFLAIRRAVATGQLGEVFHVETFQGGFQHPCDYWHSHEPVSGGLFYDWGAHYVDWILNLLPGRVRDVRAAAHKRVWHDVTNADQARVRLRFRGGAEAEFLHSDIAAAVKPKWYVLGTRGALVADWRFETVKARAPGGDLIEEALAAEAPPRVTLYLRDGAGIHTQQLSLPAPPALPFHRNLAGHLIDGEPLAVSAASARRNIAVLEAATRSVAEDGALITVDV